MAIRTVTRAGVGLVVGIIILGLLVFGGLWLVRERGEQARRDEAIAVAERRLEEESNQGAAIDTEEGEEAARPEGSAGNIPSTSTAPADTSELPQTGPEAISFAAIGILSFAVVSFMRSRKLVSDRQ